MPLYQLYCIAAHYGEYRHIKDLVTRSATLLLDRGCVVRNVKFLGTRILPQRMRRHKQYHTTGDYWSMLLDAPPPTLHLLTKQLRDDPRVVRWGTLKLADALTSPTNAYVGPGAAGAGARRRTVEVDEPLDMWGPLTPGSRYGSVAGAGAGLGLGLRSASASAVGEAGGTGGGLNAPRPIPRLSPEEEEEGVLSLTRESQYFRNVAGAGAGKQPTSSPPPPQLRP